MVTENETEDLQTEEETEEAPFVEFDISVSPSDLTLELLATQIDRGDIIIPFYQRKYVWKIEQASRLIESFLMGLPVPQVFLYVNDDGLLEVIDGQQRLLSVTYFIKGFLGRKTIKGGNKYLSLEDCLNDPSTTATHSLTFRHATSASFIILHSAPLI